MTNVGRRYRIGHLKLPIMYMKPVSDFYNKLAHFVYLTSVLRISFYFFKVSSTHKKNSEKIYKVHRDMVHNIYFFRDGRSARRSGNSMLKLSKNRKKYKIDS